MNLLFLDAVHDFKSENLERLRGRILKNTLKYRPRGDMWKYWVDRDIYPDFDDISVGSLVLRKYGYKVSKGVIDTINKYRISNCVFLFKSPMDVRERRCDCIANINVFRFTKDTTICSYLRKCFKKIDVLASYTYEYARYFFYYFYSKALKEGLSCGFDIKDRVMKELKSDTLKGLPLILTFTSGAILGLKGEYMKKAYDKIRGTLLPDGGAPPYKYFYYISPSDIEFSFYGRTLPTIIFLEGVLNYDKEHN